MRGLDLFRETNGISVPDFNQNGVYSTVFIKNCYYKKFIVLAFIYK